MQDLVIEYSQSDRAIGLSLFPCGLDPSWFFIDALQARCLIQFSSIMLEILLHMIFQNNKISIILNESREVQHYKL